MIESPIELSIVVPFYNEEESIYPLCEATMNALKKVTDNYEIILVDDGSSDATFKNAVDYSKIEPRVKVIKLKINSGQTAALHAGFEFASGDIIMSMDGDLQNDPEDIEKFVNKIYEGNDIVMGWRKDRKDDLFTRKIPSQIANWLIRKVTGVPVKDNGCAIRAYRKEVIKQIPLYSEMHRLLPVMTALSGARFTQLEVNHRPRIFGQSKYGLSRIYKVLFDLTALKMYLSSFYIPLFGFGFLSIILGLLFLAVLIGAFVYAALYPGANIVVLIGIGLLLGEISFFLLSLGIICHLVYSSGNLKVEKLYRSMLRKRKTEDPFKN
jgi:glycosyltransferase involved in cell wall biosynthesis